MFDPIEYKPHGTAASTTSTVSPAVAPKNTTSRVSASSVPLTGELSQAEDTEDTEDSVPEVEPAGGLGDTELESDVELSVEEDDTSLPAVTPGQSFSSIRESRAQFSSPKFTAFALIIIIIMQRAVF